MTRTHSMRSISLLLSVVACDGRPDLRDCSDVDLSLAEGLPMRLSEVGFYRDVVNQVVSDTAIEFTPRYPLWTDGATKRRWIVLPEGGSVQTQDADDWSYPVGTATFKEFTRDDVRVETRMNLKTEDGWAAAAYIWNDAGDDAVRQLVNAPNVAGTPHDVPGAAECQACHGGRGDFTLGFSATQLDPETRRALFDAGVLSDRVEDDLELDPTAESGLGVLHGNCSHCHNPHRDDQPQATDCYAPGDRVDFDLSLPHDLDDLTEAPALRTGSEVLGETGDSKVIERMTTRAWDDDRPPMPPLGTELVDEEGVAAVRAFIDAI